MKGITGLFGTFKTPFWIVMVSPRVGAEYLLNLGAESAMGDEPL
jgi:hypothetical protein